MFEKAKPNPPPKPPQQPKRPPYPEPPSKPPMYPDRKVPKTPANKIMDVINKIIGTNGKPDVKPNAPPPPSNAKPNIPKREEEPRVKPNFKKPPNRRGNVKELNGKSLLFTKEGEQMRWLCDFTNNFRDRDNPPEILASVAHERFVKEVDECIWPMPELWWWHLDGTRLGQADWIGYDKETGIALAAGYIDKGMEPVADAIAHYPEKVGVSHGMIYPLLEREQKDKSIITRYVTREISVLPARAAANTLTEIYIGKEKTMALTPEKIESLKVNGYSPEQIAEVEERNKAKADEAKAAGIESKETEAPVVEEPAKEPVVEVPVEEKPVEPKVEDKPVTQAELKETVEALIKGFAEVVKPLQAEINTQHKMLEGMETKAREEAKKELSMTPSASIGAMIAKQFSAIGKESTLTSGRESLAKSGPKEAEAEDNGRLPFSISKILNVQQ